jgi:hypothetical protein
VAGMGGNREPLFWMGADVRLDEHSFASPLVEGVRGGNTDFALGITSNGAMARTHLRLYNQLQTSSFWPTEPEGNQIALGAGGENIVELADALATENVAVLDYVADWEAFFGKLAPNGVVSQWAQPSQATWTGAQSLTSGIWAYPDYVFIGYSPSSEQFFTGKLRHLEIDPPGCRGI